VETWERRPGAATPPLGGYRRREPQRTLLHEVKRQRSGALLLLLTPDQLLARIATLVPPPRTRAIRYHGVFAPNSEDRARVVPGGGGEPGQPVPEHFPTPARPPAALQPVVAPTWPAGPSPFQLLPPAAPVTDDPARLSPRYRVPWAELLRKVFSLDVLDCPQCGGRMELIAFIAAAGVAKRILEHLGLPSTGPPVARSPAPEETFDPGPGYDGVDSTWDE